MVIKQLMVLLLFTIINAPIFTFVDGETIFPTRAQQVNLLDNVHELFEQVKNASTCEQNALDVSFKDDMESAIKIAIFYKDALQELTSLKLRSTSNSVCSFNSLDGMEIIGNKTNEELDECKTIGFDSLLLISAKVTADIEFAVNAGENFLQKLNSCSTKKGLGVIACYNKIIQIDVIPVKTLLSEAIENHRKAHIELFGLKKAFNQCIEETIQRCRSNLEQSFSNGLNCN